MVKELINDIDAIIECFKIAPGAFDDNVWRCYSDCKKVVYQAQQNRVISAPYMNCAEYDKYINYITERLGI